MIGLFSTQRQSLQTNRQSWTNEMSRKTIEFLGHGFARDFEQSNGATAMKEALR